MAIASTIVSAIDLSEIHCVSIPTTAYQQISIRVASDRYDPTADREQFFLAQDLPNRVVWQEGPLLFTQAIAITAVFPGANDVLNAHQILLWLPSGDQAEVILAQDLTSSTTKGLGKCPNSYSNQDHQG
jgi:hypothetical protein